MDAERPPRQELTWAGAALVTAVGLGVILAWALGTGVLQVEQGCPVVENPRNPCMGPEGAYWTVWGAELDLQVVHAGAAGLLGAGAYAWLARRDAAGVRHAGLPGRVAAAVLFAAVAFFALTAAWPMTVAY